jgi:hypothetical protein
VFREVVEVIQNSSAAPINMICSDATELVWGGAILHTEKLYNHYHCWLCSARKWFGAKIIVPEKNAPD